LELHKRSTTVDSEIAQPKSLHSYSQIIYEESGIIYKIGLTKIAISIKVM